MNSLTFDVSVHPNTVSRVQTVPKYNKNSTLINGFTLEFLLANSVREAYNMVLKGIKILKNIDKEESSCETELRRQEYMELFFRMVEAQGVDYNPRIVEICNMYIYYNSLLPVAI